MTILDEIKQYMEQSGLNYEEASQLIGWKKQNLWDKLNKRTEVTYDSVRKILNGFGAELEFIDVKSGCAMDLTELDEALQDEHISFECVKKLMELMDYETVITFPPKH